MKLREKWERVLPSLHWIFCALIFIYVYLYKGIDLNLSDPPSRIVYFLLPSIQNNSVNSEIFVQNAARTRLTLDSNYWNPYFTSNAFVKILINALKRPEIDLFSLFISFWFKKSLRTRKKQWSSLNGVLYWRISWKFKIILLNFFSRVTTPIPERLYNEFPDSISVCYTV